jgi:NAD(P)H-dependent FMN reductase
LAAAEADAVLVLTSYHGRVPSIARNAIDWLTHRWRRDALHRKPIAVVGRASGHYSGVLSHRAADARGALAHRMIEPLTVPTLHEAVKKVADEASRHPTE